MDFLTDTFLGNTPRAWAVALGLAVVTYAALRIVTVRVVGGLARAAAGTRARWDDVLTDALKATKRLLLLIVAVFAGATALDLQPRIVGILRSVTIIALLVQSGLWVSKGLTSWLRLRSAQLEDDDPAEVMTMNVIIVVTRLILWAMILLLALDNMGIDVTALVAGLGIGGIAVALAAQNILGDLFASLSIVLDKPFVLGDFLVMGDYVGSVEAIGLKTTRVRSLSGEQVIFSNTDLLGSRIRNYGRLYQRRVLLSVGVTYQTELHQLEAIPGIMRDAIEAEGDRVRFDRAHLASYGDFAIVFEAVYFVLSPDYVTHMDIKQAVLLRVHGAFDELGVGFAYPTQTVFLEKAAGA